VILGLFHELRDLMTARKFPLTWEYGPLNVKIEDYPDSLVVVERDRTRADAVRPSLGTQGNPKKYRMRDLGAEIRIYARSTVEGAHVGNHEDLCEQIVDGLIVSLIEWGSSRLASADVPIVESRYLSPGERDDVECWPGVIYLLRINVPRAVYKRDFTGAAEPTGAIAGITRSTTARLAGTTDTGSDTGCSTP
jgi:hypothetical protein